MDWIASSYPFIYASAKMDPSPTKAYSIHNTYAPFGRYHNTMTWRTSEHNSNGGTSHRF